MTPEYLTLQGYYLFPVGRDKVPLVKWRGHSTVDVTQIAKWSRKFPDCWWGVDCGRSGLIVLDDDRGKNLRAADSLMALELEYGDLPPTYTVRTVSGGRHYYFWGNGMNSASSKLGPGLDSRGDGGYVIAPGSPGYEVECPAPVADAPEWLEELLAKPLVHGLDPAKDVAQVELDTDTAVARATEFLKRAPLALEGDGGDLATYQVACRVRDLGITGQTCLNLMLDYWNDRCEPPWDLDELTEKVSNAYRYAENPAGSSLPGVTFEEHFEPVVEGGGLFVDANTLMARDIKVEYLVNGLIETPSTGLIFGDPSAGKSFLGIDLSAAVATGGDWMGNLCQQGIAVYFAGEGRHGVRRRLKAWCKHRGVGLPDGGLFVSERRIEFTRESLKGVATELKAAERATGSRVKLCVVDTLARHIPVRAEENSAKDMGNFINAIDWLRDKFGCVVAVVHHSGKQAKAYSRGSSAIRGAMDWEFRVVAANGQRAVEFTKQKESELPSPFGFRLERVELPGEGTTSAVPVTCEYDRTRGKAAILGRDAGLALDILQTEGGGGSLLKKEWKTAFNSSLEREGCAESTMRQKFWRALQKLMDAGLVECEDGKFSPIED